MKIEMTAQEAIAIALDSYLDYDIPYQRDLIDAAFQTLNRAVSSLVKTPWFTSEEEGDARLFLLEAGFCDLTWKEGDNELYTPEIIAWIWDNLDDDGFLSDSKEAELRALKDAQKAR